MEKTSKKPSETADPYLVVLEGQEDPKVSSDPCIIEGAVILKPPTELVQRQEMVSDHDRWPLGLERVSTVICSDCIDIL